MGPERNESPERDATTTPEASLPKPPANTLGATEEELEWARNIKAAANTSGLPKLTDFEYLHHGSFKHTKQVCSSDN